MLKIAGLNVIAIVADGAPNNRKFFKMHAIPEYKKLSIACKVPNLYNPVKFMYFVANVHHLIKTVRNAWYNSSHNGTRKLEVRMCCIITYL